MADHCRQWCTRHPPTRLEGATESVGEFSRPFALATGVAGTAGGSGKGPSMVVALIRVVSSLRVSLVVATQRLLLTGGQQRTSRCVSRPVGGVGPAVALCWSLRNMGVCVCVQGLTDEGIVGGCASLVECRIQEHGGEDSHGGW